MNITVDNGVLRDERGNTASVVNFGTEEAARSAIESLVDCWGCSGCSRCSGCSDCWGCSGCSGCSRCSDCSDCSGCSRCSDCSGCSGCSDCSDCSRCSGCSGCSGCSDSAPISGAFVVPVIAGIHKAVYEAASKPGALNMGSWHACETTHCRAGWVVHLAGKAGAELEAKTSTEFAAMQIYKASSPLRVSPARFFDSNEAAMQDMRRLAEAEAVLDCGDED